MTEDFYCNFLDFISAKEKQTLCVQLQKRKIRVDGFRMEKYVPSRLLAKQIAKNEKDFYEMLQDCYSPTYADKNEAIQALSPDTAVLFLTYLSIIDDVNEEDFLNLLLSKKDSAAGNQSPPVLNDKAQKKNEEFRQKYLAAYKELGRVKDVLEANEKENNELKSLLNMKETELQRMKEELTDANERIKELEGVINEQNRINELQKNQVLVLLKTNRFEIPGAAILQYDDITQLEEMADDYTEILFVANDLPFAVKRLIHKMDSIQNKIHTFSTQKKLLEYAAKRRHN